MRLLFIFLAFSSILPADVVNISPDAVDFGSLIVGRESIKTVTLVNPTKKTLNVSDISVPAGFQVFIVSGTIYLPGTPCIGAIEPGSQCQIGIGFLAQTPGDFTGVLAVNDDANTTPQKVRLRATAIPVALVSIQIQPASPVIPKGLTT